MSINRESVKQKIKDKITQLREMEEVTDDDTLEFYTEIYMIIIDELLQNATVTGTCSGAGGQLTQGKIT